MVKKSSTNTVSFLVFGGTGDLTSRKLFPAFLQLWKKGLVSQSSVFIGIGRSDYLSESYRKMLFEHLKLNESEYAQVNVKYVRLQYDDENAYIVLQKKLLEWETEKTQSRIIYFATTYSLFGTISHCLQKSSLVHSKTKLVFEKPFGHDLASATQLERDIHKVFDESSVFRIDHYLGKETVQNITSLKFTNPIIEAMLSSSHVESITVEVNEDMGVGNRLGYYNEAGAIKDMVQSHLLQVLALLLMNNPQKICDDCIHDEKVKMLRSLSPQPASKQIIGQYDSYASELKKGGFIDKRTETYCRLALQSSHPRWRSTSLYVQTGKYLHEKAGRIIVLFKHPKGFHQRYEGIHRNRLVIDIQPHEDIVLHFNTLERNNPKKVINVKMEFCGTCLFGPNSQDGYAQLLEDIMRGDHTLFTRDDEIKQSWRIVDEIMKMKPKLQLHTYKKGSVPQTIGVK